MAEDKPLRVMSIMAHQDDFEFTAGGSFALLRQEYGCGVEMKIVATSRGASGHHELSREETFARRGAEAARSAKLIGASYECLRQLDGTCVDAQVLIDHNLLGGLWNTIRRFEPDAIFCPPVPADPLAGVHVDHVNTAIAVRLLGYQIGVPNAYPTTSGPRKRRVRIPLIINVDDAYACEGGFHVRQDIRECYEQKARMAACHESQIYEWLPWMADDAETMTADRWRESFHQRHIRINKRFEQDDGIYSEYFHVTSWGRSLGEGDLDRLFPRIIAQHAPKHERQW